MKKVIIAGTRTFDNYKLLDEILSKFQKFSVKLASERPHKDVIVDNMGRLWAIKHEYPYKMFIPKWQEEGKIAGFNRNVEMADYADEAICIWNGISKGTEHMINIMKGIGKPVRVITYEE